MAFNLITSLHQGRLSHLTYFMLPYLQVLSSELQTYFQIKKKKKKKKIWNWVSVNLKKQNPKKTPKNYKTSLAQENHKTHNLDEQKCTLCHHTHKKQKGFTHWLPRAWAPDSPNSITLVRPGSSGSLVLLLIGDNWASTAAEWRTPLFIIYIIYKILTIF